MVVGGKMKRLRKNIVNTLLSICIIFASLFTNAFTSHAVDNQFIPFRSDYVKYISQNAYSNNNVIQYVWLQLFKEENNWTEGQSYYSSGYNSWSEKYYGDYTNSYGSTQSSKGVRVTYNPEFDSFLYGTIISNNDFIVNWINQESEIFSNYCININDHPYFADGLIELTKKGYLLGDGKDKGNNIFEYGSSADSAAKWTIDNRQDFNILAVLGSKYLGLSEDQKKWIKTYIPYLVDDYIKNRGNAFASKEKNQNLYDLIASSGYGFTKSQVNQEFFNYLISNPDKKVGQLIINGADYMGASDTFKTGPDDIAENSDLKVIFAGDGDCDPNDEDYDWLAYQICFNNSDFYKILRDLVEGNTTTYTQMQEWLIRYYRTHANSGSKEANEINSALLKSGKTESLSTGYNTATGCGVDSSDPSGYWGGFCGGHDIFLSTEVMKKMGICTISTSYSAGQGYTSGGFPHYSVTITDTKTGAIIYQVQNAGSVSYRLPDKYIWSNSVKISMTMHYHWGCGQYGHLSGGSCPKTGQAWGYINGTYVATSKCQSQGHKYSYSYQWNSNHSACTANGVCLYCGDRLDYTDDSIQVTSRAEGLSYYADFKHVGNGIEPKTYVEPKGTACLSFNSSSSAISGQPALANTFYDNTDYNAINEHNKYPMYTISTTFSLKSGNIKPGVKSISVNVYASSCRFKIYDKYGQLIYDSSTFYSSKVQDGYVMAEDISHNINLEDYSDSKLAGAYLVVNMSSTAFGREADATGYHFVTDVDTHLNSIKVNY